MAKATNVVRIPKLPNAINRFGYEIIESYDAIRIIRIRMLIPVRGNIGLSCALRIAEFSCIDKRSDLS